MVFHYSGHGGQIQDMNGDEEDGIDETLVPWNSERAEDDIIDDEIYQLIIELNEKTPHVTLIMDSCFSGTVAKSGLGMPRLVERPVTPASTVGTNGDYDKDGIYTLLTGCESQQRSYEFNAPTGETHGALSYHFVKAVEEKAKQGKLATTYRDIMDLIKQRVSAVRPQTPVLGGTLDDKFVFGDDSAIADPHLVVTLLENDLVQLPMGESTGNGLGDRVAFYSPATKTFEKGQEIATGKVISAGAFESTVRVEGNVEILEGARAVVTEQRYRNSKVTVFLDTKGMAYNDIATSISSVNNEDAIKSIRKAISNDGFLGNVVNFVENEQEAMVVVTVINTGHIAILLNGELQTSFAKRLQNGQPVYEDKVRVDSNDREDRFVDLLMFWIKWEKLRRLTNVSNQQVVFSIDGANGSDVTNGSLKFLDRTIATISIENKGARPLFYSILDVSSDGTIAQLWPSNGNAEQLLPGVPVKRKIKLFVPASRQRVVDHIKLMVFEKNVNTWFLTTDAAPRSDFRAMLPFYDASNVTIKGGQAVETESWTAKTQMIVIEK